MSNARARANHELYLARLVLNAWRSALEQQDTPASTLAQAFLGGTREHLIAAYGWFLLEICQAEASSQGPPRGCQGLPAMPEGKVFPGEINEFRQLEASGWLAEMLRGDTFDLPVARRQDNLAMASGDLPGAEQAQRWLAALEALFARMSDSLDEY